MTVADRIVRMTHARQFGAGGSDHRDEEGTPQAGAKMEAGEFLAALAQGNLVVGLGDGLECGERFALSGKMRGEVEGSEQSENEAVHGGFPAFCAYQMRRTGYWSNFGSTLNSDTPLPIPGDRWSRAPKSNRSANPWRT